MVRENKTQFALLGVLMYGTFSGYEIKKMIDRSIGFFWTENFGHIYPVLSSLEKKGFVEKRKIQQEKRPSKNVYDITEKGKDHFYRWLRRDAEYEKIKHEVLLKVFFGGFDRAENIKEKLLTEKRLHEDLLAEYKEVEKHMGKNHPESRDRKYWDMTLEFGKRYSTMALGWCRDMIEVMEGKKGG